MVDEDTIVLFPFEAHVTVGEFCAMVQEDYGVECAMADRGKFYLSIILFIVLLFNI